MLGFINIVIKQVRAVEPPLEDWDKEPFVYKPGPGGDRVAQFKALEPIFRNILSLAMIAGALVCFVMLVAGGFRFMTSGGDPKKTAAAGATITYAVLGLVMFIGAWFIMKFIREFTGVDVTVFEIPGP
jgi:drug/metabolite transporter (DMT)-like permease